MGCCPQDRTCASQRGPYHLVCLCATLAWGSMSGAVFSSYTKRRKGGSQRERPALAGSSEARVLLCPFLGKRMPRKRGALWPAPLWAWPYTASPQLAMVASVQGQLAVLYPPPQSHVATGPSGCRGSVADREARVERSASVGASGFTWGDGGRSSGENNRFQACTGCPGTHRQCSTPGAPAGLQPKCACAWARVCFVAGPLFSCWVRVVLHRNTRAALFFLWFSLFFFCSLRTTDSDFFFCISLWSGCL